MELRQLTTFIQVAQYQSFSKAAAHLGYSQSAVTVQIRQLEEELQVRLFDRIYKRVILTAHGQQFLTNAYAILQEVNRATLALANAEEQLTGQVHIGTLESLCFARMPEMIRRFRAVHPGVSLQITTGTPEELTGKMERGEVDMIYLLDDPLCNNNWNKLMERQEQVVMVASANLGQALVPGPHRLVDLLHHPFFLTERDENYRRLLDHQLAACGHSLTPALESSCAPFLLRALETTDGLSYLPWFLVEEKVRQGVLQLVEVADLQAVMYCQVFCHKEKWVTREMKEFVRLCSCPNISKGDAS